MNLKMLKGNTLFLRSVEPSDAQMLMIWENDPENWKVTDTEVPFSLHGIHQLIEQQQQIRSTGQLRMMICLHDSDRTVGAVDLYDADFRNGKAAIGILIGDRGDRERGYAGEALQLIIDYARDVLGLYNLYCSVQADNSASLKLFDKSGFRRVGTRTDWFNMNGQRIDEIIFQLCLRK